MPNCFLKERQNTEMTVVEGYCSKVTQAVAWSCCGQSGSSVLTVWI